MKGLGIEDGKAAGDAAMPESVYVTGLDFTRSIRLFDHLQNGGRALLETTTRRLMKILRFPFVLIVTCDRAEVLGMGRASCEVLERALSVSPIAAAKCRYSLEGEEAERHVMLLATGTISPLFGEDTVQGQIAMACDVARLSGSSCPALNKLCNMAVAFSKRMHSTHRIRVFDHSIAAEVARRLKGMPNILVTGSGEGARIVAGALLEDGHEVHMALRDETKTFLIPVGARAVSYDDRMSEAKWADAVVSASSGLYHTFSVQECLEIAPKPMFDLASPDDLPDAENVTHLADMRIAQPEKDAVIRLVACEADREMAAYRAWREKAEGHVELEDRAEEVAIEAMRRLSGCVHGLGLDDDGERRVRQTILDSVKKAYVTKEYAWRKGARGC